MIESQTLQLLNNKKNLLAFSAGIDSTALFFLLLDHDISFDIAIVDYNVRKQSKEEIAYAKEIAHKYNLQCFTYSAPHIKTNFEANARKIRYDFFENIIVVNNYDNLITAHHLGDRFEWMMMQFCKGAGCVEMAGMQKFQQKNSYLILRPLLHITKSQLESYLHNNNIKYFIDESNNDPSIQRNYFRQNITNKLIDTYYEGIKKSFSYIDQDISVLYKNVEIFEIGTFAYFKSSNNKRSDLTNIDHFVKQKGHLSSASERAMLLQDKSVVLGRQHLVVQQNNYIFILPYNENQNAMDKPFKEQCRKLQIDPKMRPYLFSHPNVFKKVQELLGGI